MNWRIPLVGLALGFVACGPVIDERTPKVTMTPDKQALKEMETAFPTTIGLRLEMTYKAPGSGEVTTALFVEDIDFLSSHPYILKAQRSAPLVAYADKCDKFYEEHKEYLDRWAPILRDRFNKTKKAARDEAEKLKTDMTAEQLAHAEGDASTLSNLLASLTETGVKLSVNNHEGTPQGFEVSVDPTSDYSQAQLDALDAYLNAAKAYKESYGEDLISNLLEAQIVAIEETI